jgi:hypothetical protein
VGCLTIIKNIRRFQPYSPLSSADYFVCCCVMCLCVLLLCVWAVQEACRRWDERMRMLLCDVLVCVAVVCVGCAGGV